MRPCDSVTGTRWTRCTPPSYLSRATRSRPGRRRCRAPCTATVDRPCIPPRSDSVGVEHLGPPAAPLGVAQVHPQQVAGEQRRLLAALARLDLDDHVLVVGRVARQQQRRSRSASSSPAPSSASASAANAASSAASSRAAARSPPSPLPARGRSRRPGSARRSAGRAARGRGLVGVHAGVGELRRSSSACSASSSARRSNTGLRSSTTWASGSDTRRRVRQRHRAGTRRCRRGAGGATWLASWRPCA